MLKDVYRKIDQATVVRTVANKLNNSADSMETDVCEMFNKKIKVEHMLQLSRFMSERNAFDSEKEELEELINKRQKGDLDFDDTKKYRMFENKYGENLDYNKSFIDRFMESMED